MNADPYRGITYPSIFDNRFVHWAWRRWFCPRDIHLWDEVTAYFVADDGGHEHHLVCDPCQLTVWIERIDDSYVADETEEER